MTYVWENSSSTNSNINYFQSEPYVLFVRIDIHDEI